MLNNMVGIVFCNELNTCPYIDKYLKILNQKEIPYEIIIWNRSGEKKQYPENFVVFNEKSDIFVPRWKKFGAFMRFRSFLKRTIKERHYDKLIMLSTVPAILCYKQLVKKYKGKYIFDFRDLSYERHGFFRKKVKNIAKRSFFTSLSSPGFAEKLELNKYVMAHNFRYNDLDNAIEELSIDTKPIQLLHIGITRGEEFNKRLADIFGNDNRFQVNIIGSGNDTETFKAYVKDIPNIQVKGTYNNEDKMKFICGASMLLYYYPGDYNCDSALANKYYDGMIYKKPLIGNINTYSGRRVEDKGLGISLDISDVNFADKVFTYITTLNKDSYLKAVKEEMIAVLEEDSVYLRRIEEFLDA